MGALRVSFEEIERGDVLCMLRVMAASARGKGREPTDGAEREITIDEWRRMRGG